MDRRFGRFPATHSLQVGPCAAPPPPQRLTYAWVPPEISHRRCPLRPAARGIRPAASRWGMWPAPPSGAVVRRGPHPLPPPIPSWSPRASAMEDPGHPLPSSPPLDLLLRRPCSSVLFLLTKSAGACSSVLFPFRIPCRRRRL
ncbi:hypothetical protein PVAP13_5KG748850 [Panicum virgatum]|uniref:Uncharacterized protein n=1 Tax=Panicum virgatum TaxID=38727 RepID=A0A8T0T1P9_PANVG|nr:hypothetical protein PVAP13_5KG748850 [Panicum virgatum]